VVFFPYFFKQTEASCKHITILKYLLKTVV
jgi:hypothetical protein